MSGRGNQGAKKTSLGKPAGNTGPTTSRRQTLKNQEAVAAVAAVAAAENTKVKQVTRKKGIGVAVAAPVLVAEPVLAVGTKRPGKTLNPPTTKKGTTPAAEAAEAVEAVTSKAPKAPKAPKSSAKASENLFLTGATAAEAEQYLKQQSIGPKKGGPAAVSSISMAVSPSSPSSSSMAVSASPSASGPDLVRPVDNLLIVDQFPEDIPEELALLNQSVRLLQKQLLRRDSELQFDDKTKGTYQGTQRCIGLFPVDTSLSRPQVVEVNLLKGTSDELIGSKDKDGSPNKVLADCLDNAIDEMEKNGVATDRIKGWKTLVGRVRLATRGEIAKADKDIVDDILEAFLNYANSIPDPVQRLIALLRVYGPLLIKGLSDISQAGALAKYYILKCIELIKRRNAASPSKSAAEVHMEESAPSSSSSSSSSSAAGHSGRSSQRGEDFWNKTGGLPVSVSLSSDSIAAVLGNRIADVLYGGYNVELPRKNGTGRMSVFFMRNHLIGLMGVLGGVSSVSGGGDPEANLVEQVKQFKKDFAVGSGDAYLRACSDIEGIDITRIRPTIQFCDDPTFSGLGKLSENLYNYYRTIARNPNEFSVNMLDILDTLEGENVERLDGNTNDETKEAIIVVLETFDMFSTFKQTFTTLSDQQVYVLTIRYFRNILLNFGNFICKLDTLAQGQGELLEQIFSRASIPSGGNKLPYLEFTAWSETVVLSMSYFRFCQTMNNTSETRLAEKILDISQIEESCAELDVDYGHDQESEVIQQIGIQVAEIMGKNERGNFRDITKNKKVKEVAETSNPENIMSVESSSATASAVAPRTSGRASTAASSLSSKASKPIHYDERELCMTVLKELRMSSYCLTTSDNGQGSVIKVSLTTDNPDENLAFTERLPGIMPDKSSVIHTGAIGPNCILHGVDYFVSDPAVTATKKRIQRGFSSVEEIMQYLKIEGKYVVNFTETDFDAAAPASCVYKTTDERLGESHRFFRTTDGKQFLFVILTNSNDERREHRSLDLSEKSCLMKEASRLPSNIFVDDISNIKIKDRLLADRSKTMSEMQRFSVIIERTNFSNSARKIMDVILKEPNNSFNKYLKDNTGTGTDTGEIAKILKAELPELNRKRQAANQTAPKATAWREYRIAADNFLKNIIKMIGKTYSEKCIGISSSSAKESAKESASLASGGMDIAVPVDPECNEIEELVTVLAETATRVLPSISSYNSSSNSNSNSSDRVEMFSTNNFMKNIKERAAIVGESEGRGAFLAVPTISRQEAELRREVESEVSKRYEAIIAEMRSNSKIDALSNVASGAYIGMEEEGIGIGKGQYVTPLRKLVRSNTMDSVGSEARNEANYEEYQKREEILPLLRETYGDNSEYYYDNANVKYNLDNNIKLGLGQFPKPWVNNSNDNIIQYIKRNESKFPKPPDSVKQSLKQKFSEAISGDISELSSDENMDYSDSNSNSNSSNRIIANPIIGRKGLGRDFPTSSSSSNSNSNSASSNTANAYLSYPPLLNNGPKNFGGPSIMDSDSGRSGYASDTSTVDMGGEGDGTGYASDASTDDMEEKGGSKRSRKRRIKKHKSKKRVKKSKGRKTRKVRRVKKSKPKKRSLKRKVQKPKSKPKPKSKAKRRSIKRKVQKHKSKKSGKKSKLLKTKKRGIKKNTRRK